MIKFFIQMKDKNSVDLLVTEDKSPFILIEGKIITSIHKTKSKGKTITKIFDFQRLQGTI